MTGRAREISAADERSEGSYRACLAGASHPGKILTHCLLFLESYPLNIFQKNIYFSVGGRCGGGSDSASLAHDGTGG